LPDAATSSVIKDVVTGSAMPTVKHILSMALNWRIVQPPVRVLLRHWGEFSLRIDRRSMWHSRKADLLVLAFEEDLTAEQN